MEHYTIKGNYAECGLQLGKLMSKEIAARMRDFNINQNTLARHKRTLHKIDSICRNAFPELVEELESMAVGANISYWYLLLLNTSEIVASERCTSIAVAEDHHIILAHNEDAQHDKKTWCKLVTFEMPHITFTAYVYPGEMPGSSFCWNSKGLYFAVDYVFPMTRIPYFGIPRTFIARTVIESKNLKEAIARIKSFHCATGYHYFIGKGKEIYSIEQTRRNVSIIRVEGILPHTNHYVHPIFATRAKYSKSSKIRLARVSEMLLGGAHPLEALFDKKNKPFCVYNNKVGRRITLATVVFDPENHTVVIYNKDSTKYKQVFKF